MKLNSLEFVHCNIDSGNVPPNSDIRQHALDFDHPIKLENFKLVNKSSKYEIKIVESILIHKLGPNLNDRGSSFPLSILQ